MAGDRGHVERRLVLLVVAALTLLSAAGCGPASSGRAIPRRPARTSTTSPAPRATAPLSLPIGRHLSATDPLRVMIVGDSVMHSAEPGIAAALQATGVVTIVYDDSTLGWGLVNHSPTRPFNYDWRSQFPALIAQYHPELVIGMWSWDDDAAQSDPRGYGQTLDQAVSLLLAPGNGVDGVVLTRFPQLDPQPSFLALYRSTGWTTQTSVAGVEGARNAWNAVASLVAAQHPGQVLYSGASTVVDTMGRAVDGVHFCPSGAVLLGQAVAGQLAEILALPPPRPGWQAAVAADPRYGVQPGLCPAGR